MKSKTIENRLQLEFRAKKKLWLSSLLGQASQKLVKMGAGIILFLSFLVFLINLVGLAVASMLMLQISQKYFDVTNVFINPNAFNF